MTDEDDVRTADKRYGELIQKVRLGQSLSRRERRDLMTWLAVRRADYLVAIGERLTAPSEIPSELSEG